MQVHQRFFMACYLAFPLAALLNAQAPAIQNADLVMRPAANNVQGGIEALIAASTDPVWIAYSVPMIPGGRPMCCFHGDEDSGCCRGCRLEEGRQDTQGISRLQTVQLEPSRTLLVMARAEAGRLDRLRAFSSDCQIDAGGRRVYWLGGVEPRQSADYLAGLVRSSGWAEKQEKRIANGALAAIAHQAGAHADAALADFLAPERSRGLRKQTAFWLSSARGATGFQAVRNAVRNDKDEHFRAEAMFALSVSKEGEAVDELVRFARNDSSIRVRKQALFWLAQKAGQKAVGALTDTIEQDPDTQVKKHAVFALSQLPAEEGVPLLIEVARKNRNPEVRKQAVFWLGQSNDPRALQFFEEVLAQ